LRLKTSSKGTTLHGKSAAIGHKSTRVKTRALTSVETKAVVRSILTSDNDANASPVQDSAIRSRVRLATLKKMTASAKSPVKQDCRAVGAHAELERERASDYSVVEEEFDDADGRTTRSRERQIHLTTSKDESEGLHAREVDSRERDSIKR
jgi:hypothetical protein